MKSSIQLNEGDEVFINSDEKAEAYFGREYKGCKVKVLSIISLTDIIIEIPGGRRYVTPVSLVSKEKPLGVVEKDERIIAAFGYSDKIPCHHPNAYINVLSARLKFKVCPDCKKDLGSV